MYQINLSFITESVFNRCVLNTQLDDSSSSPIVVGGCILYKNLLLIAGRPGYVFVLDHCVGTAWVSLLLCDG